MSFGETLLLEKSAKVGAAVNKFRIVKMGADDDHVVQASAVADVMVGVSQHDALTVEDEVRVGFEGISRLKIGGAVTRGDYLTSDASGQGVAAAPAAGTNNNVIGIALQSGVSGDIIKVALKQGRIQG